MAVEEVFVPVWAVCGVGILGVKAHDSRKDLGKEENGKTSQK